MIVFAKFTESETEAVNLIMERAEHWLPEPDFDRLTIRMDISAVHAHTPLDLEEWSKADDENFVHDLGGIRRHLDRDTGKLTDCFVPRFTLRGAPGITDDSRLPWGERRALGIEYDELSDLAGEEVSEEQLDRMEEIEEILAANPLDDYPPEEIDEYNLLHFGDTSGRGPHIHRTVETFAEATGLSVEMIRAQGITSYNSATGNPLHVLQEGA